MIESTISAKGQTTIPAAIRRLIGAVPGNRLVSHVMTDGRVFLRVKNKSNLDMAGAVLEPSDLDLLADEAKGAADRSAAAIDDALNFFAESNSRIADMESRTKSPWRIVEVKPIGDLTLRVRFADGLQGTVKFEPTHLTGVFEVLKDPEFFKQVYVELGAVTWPGELDLAPDAMYDEIKAHGEWVLS